MLTAHLLNIVATMCLWYTVYNDNSQETVKWAIVASMGVSVLHTTAEYSLAQSLFDVHKLSHFVVSAAADLLQTVVFLLFCPLLYYFFSQAEVSWDQESGAEAATHLTQGL